MATTVSAFITDLDSKYSNVYSNADKLSWVNLIEENIYASGIENLATQYYRRIKDVSQYSLPSSVAFNLLRKVYVGGRKYVRKDLRSYKERRTFWYQDSKINIHPAPSETETKYVSGAGELTFLATSYTSGASEITFASGTITTTGSDFSGFYAGCRVRISGCLTTSNNTEAVITSVAAKVLTFATGTFDADTTADTGAITIETNGIYTSGVEFSGFTNGDIIKVTGCTSKTTNNLSAELIDVQDSVLNFATGTFGAQAEAAAVTIEECGMRVTYEVLRTAKLIANIATDTLSLPDRFLDIYTMYALAMISLHDRNFTDYNNYLDLYNTRVADYLNYCDRTNPGEPTDDVQAEENWDYAESIDFDTE